MFVKFSEKAQKALVIAESSAYHLGCTEVASEHLLLSLLKMSDLVFTNTLNQYMVTDKKIAMLLASYQTQEEVPYLEYSEELRDIIEEAMKLAYQKKVTADLLGYVLINKSCKARDILQAYGVDLAFVKEKLKEKKESSLAQIHELIDLNEKVIKKKIKVIGRDLEMQLLMEMLCRKEKNNAVIVGDAGVGKTALVEKLAGYLNTVDTNHPLYGRRIYELDLASVLAGTKYRGDFEDKLKRIILALKEDKQAIVFIDEIHNLVDAGKAEGAIDASNILKPYLARGEITCIGATTYQEYKKYFEADPALNRRFAKIDLKEESEEATFLILKGLKKDYEIFHHIQIEDVLLKKIVELTNQYMRDRHQPDKSLDVLDLCCVKTRMLGNKQVEQKMVETVIESLCGFTLGQKNSFEALQNELQSQFFGQNKAIQDFCQSLNQGKKTFLFFGPTGVGKTEIIKQTSKFLHRHLIRFHMGEFKDAYTMNKLLGTAPGYVGYDKQKPFLEEIKRYPESIVLLDDAHLAHPQILQFFVKIFDEKDYENVDFSHVIFVMTTKNQEKEATGFLKKKTQPEVLFPGLFERVDVVIEFKPLDRQSAKAILDYHEIKDEKLQEELLECDYNQKGARILLKRLKEKQSENTCQP